MRQKMKEDVEKVRKATQDYANVLEKAIIAAKAYQTCKQERKQAKQIYDSVITEVKQSRIKQADEINKKVITGDWESYDAFKQEYEIIHSCIFHVFDRENVLTLTEPHSSDDDVEIAIVEARVKDLVKYYPQ